MERKIRYRAYIMTKKKDDIQNQEWLAKQAGYALKELDDVVVTSPSHYTRLEFQPIDFLMRNEFSYWRGAIIKYACRAGHKLAPGKTRVQSEIDDLSKIIEYAEFRKRQLLGQSISGAEDEHFDNQSNEA